MAEIEKFEEDIKAIREEKPANARKKPSSETLDYAQNVLLGVVPRTYLKGAEINPFESEIHVTWEDDNSGKRVIVFFPAGPKGLKIYHEVIQNGVVVEHELVNTQKVSDVSDSLRWFFKDDTGINLTPKTVKVELDSPVREHLDEAAIKRGWELFKKTRKLQED